MYNTPGFLHFADGGHRVRFVQAYTWSSVRGIKAVCIFIHIKLYNTNLNSNGLDMKQGRRNKINGTKRGYVSYMAEAQLSCGAAPPWHRRIQSPS
jgi:hypothetical protein